MAQSPEGSRLSGLARSIDALFSPPAAAGPATAPLPPHDEPETSPEASLDDRPLAAEMFPATQAFDAIPQRPVEPTDLAVPAAGMPVEEPAQDFDPLLSFESPWSEPLASETVPAEPMQSMEAPEAAEAPAATIEPSAPELAISHPVAPAAPADEPASFERAFLAAVDAWAQGDRTQRDRIETLAAGLRDRLALDPLADAVQTLVRAAGDPPDRTYLALATTVMNPAVASRLVQRMGRERDEARREEYMNLCRRIGLLMANGLKGALTSGLEKSVRALYRDALVSMGAVSRPIIEAMAEDENLLLVGDAVTMLGEIGGERAVQLVTNALANTDPRVREKALRALGELGDEEAGRLSLGFLDDSDPKVRVAAALTAAKFRLERALRPILQLLDQEEDPADRVRLLQALGELGDPGAVPAIEKHAAPGRFAKSSTDVRVAAYKALHQIGTPHARELVERAANDKEPAVRAALRGLVREA